MEVTYVCANDDHDNETECYIVSFVVMMNHNFDNTFEIARCGEKSQLVLPLLPYRLENSVIVTTRPLSHHEKKIHVDEKNLRCQKRRATATRDKTTTVYSFVVIGPSKK